MLLPRLETFQTIRQDMHVPCFVRYRSRVESSKSPSHHRLRSIYLFSRSCFGFLVRAIIIVHISLYITNTYRRSADLQRSGSTVYPYLLSPLFSFVRPSKFDCNNISTWPGPSDTLLSPSFINLPPELPLSQQLAPSLPPSLVFILSTQYTNRNVRVLAYARSQCHFFQGHCARYHPSPPLNTSHWRFYRPSQCSVGCMRTRV
ncbi:hypothetical protein RSAG8_01141, partial [Rhizoctonia solani AG-8 WAC10335]